MGEIYSKKIQESQLEIDKISKGIRKIALFRLAIFFVSIFVFWFAYSEIEEMVFAIIAPLLGAFLFFVKKSISLKKEREYFKKIKEVNEEEQRSIYGEFEAFEKGEEFHNELHPYHKDLDIFSVKGLFQRLNRTCTKGGKQELADALSYPNSDIDEIKAKQTAVIELSELIDLRQEFLAKGKLFGNSTSDQEELKYWMEGNPKFTLGKVMTIYLKIVPFLSTLIVTAYLFDVISQGALLGYGFINLQFALMKLGKSTKLYNQITPYFEQLKKYGILLELIEKSNFNSPWLQQLKDRLTQDQKHAPSHSLREFSKIVQWYDSRNNIVIAIVVNAFFLVELRSAKAISDWRNRHFSDLENWLEQLAKFDAICSLSNWKYNRPEDVFPNLQKEKFSIVAKEVGHPFIDVDELVRNDYSVEHKANIDILTGANMAGKSTFLRSIGINLILGMTGSVVCAKQFDFTPIALFTSLRTTDSLNDSESYFYAELKRLRSLVELYDSNKIPVFFLLDEILKGTNSHDQHEGSVGLIKKLLKFEANGIIATHDLELSSLEVELSDHVRNYCFEINIEEDQLLFDYKLSRGVCKTMNASLLMRQMNIID